MSYPLFHPSCNREAPTRLSVEEFAHEFPTEDEHVEFKEGIPLDRIAETASAFSNTDGGVILLGVFDDGSVKGCALGKKSEAQIHGALGAVEGLGEYTINRLDVEGHELVAIGVARPRAGYAQLRSGAIKERRGPSNQTLRGQQLNAFISRRSGQSAEVLPTRATPGDIDWTLARRLADARRWNNADGPVLLQRLRDTGFIVEAPPDERLSVLGALFLLPDPVPVLGKAYVDVFRYRDDGIDYDRREEFCGPLYDQVHEATDFVLADLGFDMPIVGVERREMNRLPRLVLREAIANAVAHRSYAVTGGVVRVEIRPDRVVVRSPGSLIEGVTLGDIADRSMSRNPQVIRNLRHFQISEDAGRGVSLMRRHMELNFMSPPSFAADKNSVTVVLPLGSAATPAERARLALMLSGPAKLYGPHSVGENEPRDSPVRVQDAHVLLRVMRWGSITNAGARDLLGTDAVESLKVLQRLRDLDLLSQEGNGSGTYYRLASRFGGRTPDFISEILEIARDGPITNADVRAKTGLDRVAAVRVLNRLVDEGRLERRGTKRGAHYVLRDPSGRA